MKIISAGYNQNMKSQNQQSFGMELALGKNLANKILTKGTTKRIEKLDELLIEINPRKTVMLDLTNKGSLRLYRDIPGSTLIKEISEKLFKVKELKDGLVDINFAPKNLTKSAKEFGETIMERLGNKS